MSTCVWARGAVSNPDHDCSLRYTLVPQLVGVASLVSSLGVTFVCLKIPQIQKAPQKVTIFEATETAIETPVEKERARVRVS